MIGLSQSTGRRGWDPWGKLSWTIGLNHPKFSRKCRGPLSLELRRYKGLLNCAGWTAGPCLSVPAKKKQASSHTEPHHASQLEGSVGEI